MGSRVDDKGVRLFCHDGAGAAGEGEGEIFDICNNADAAVVGEIDAGLNFR